MDKRTIMRNIFILLFTIVNSVVMAQTRFYQGNSTYSSDIILNVSGNRVYRGRLSYSSDILYTMDGPIPLPVLLMMM